MATLSRRTLAIVMKCLERRSHTSLDAFFYSMDVPDNLVVGDSKLRTILNVFKGLEAQDRRDLLSNIVFRVATDLQYEEKAELQNALLADGFVLEGADIAVDVPKAEENRSALLMLAERHEADLSVDILRHHLGESEDLFRQGKWDSAISHARNFVERLLLDIAGALAAASGETPDLARPVQVREYLQRAGFLDESERKKLADGVYGFFSEEGSHPGISTQSTARVCMHVLWAFGFYVLEKFENWKEQHG